MNYSIDPHIPYNYKRTSCTVERLCEKYRGIITRDICGKSEKGRNIYVLKLGCGKRKILFAGAIHGREYVTASFLFHSLELYASGCEFRKIFEEYSFYVVPVCNPDSVEISLGLDVPFERLDSFCHYTNKDNARGVNLNANFPFEWDFVPKERHPGKSAASEKETRFLMELCERICFEKMLSLHCRGGCIYWKDRGNGEIKGDFLFADKIARGCNFYLCPVTENKEDYSGGFENWFRYRFKKPALCIELVSDENAPFDLCCTEFEKYTDWRNTKRLFIESV